METVVILFCDRHGAWLRLSPWVGGPGIREAFHDRTSDTTTQARPPGTRRAGGADLRLRIS